MAQITVVGNLTGTPKLKFTSQGQAVASFTVAENHRRKDQSGNWVDDEPTFYQCSAWREMAENIADSLAKGMRVVVTGKLQARSYQTRDTGETRQSLEIQVDEIGPSLRYAKAQVTRNERQGGGQNPAARAADQWSQHVNPTAGITQAAPNSAPALGHSEPPF